MSASAKAIAPLTVALLGRADDARALLRRALEELGAQVVFEGDPAGLESELVLRSLPQVVLVNLASGVEDDIDHLQPLFDNPKVNVVFNEADVSSQLAGWDLARWARHLASKVMGHERTIPPPPPGSEPLPLRNYMPVPGAPPTPAQMAVERPIEEFMLEAEDLADAVPSNHLPYASTRRAPEAEVAAPDFSIDESEVEGALAQIGTTTSVEQIVVPEREVPDVVVLEDEAAEFDVGLDLSALDVALELDAAPPAPRSGKTDAELLDETLAGLNLDFNDEDVHSVAADDDDSFALDSVSFDSSGIDLIDQDSDGDEPMDADVAALAAQLDAFDASASRSAVKDLEFIDFSDEPSAPAPALRSEPSAAPAATPATGKKPSFGLLDLAPIDDGLGAISRAVGAKADGAYDFSALNFSLEPTSEEMDALEAAPVDALLSAMDLAPAKAAVAKVATGRIQQVIVLGASIGGPDALRTFLGGIPAGFPVLFLLVQHLENGFFERLAQQLQKASKVPVRVADAKRAAIPGEVLVIPAQQRVMIDANGAITLHDHDTSPKYTPCIDDVMRDAADTFGANVTAIIFSGMAGDAIEGAVYLTTQGGEVWAQDPASCVVSSMVDGASARGVVEFVGSPRELADHCVARYGKG